MSMDPRRPVSESSDESRRLPGGLLLPLLVACGVLLVLTFWILNQENVGAQSQSQFSTVLDTFSPVTAVTGSATFGLVNQTYPVATLTVSGDAAFVSTVVPSSFESLQSFSLVTIPQETGSSKNYDIRVNYAGQSESITIHSDSDLSSVYSVNQDVFELLDLSGLLASLSPSDIIGVEVGLGDSHPLQVVGVLGQYQSSLASTADPLLDLEIGLDCSSFANGGTLTTTGSGIMFCSDDDSAGSPAWGDITGTLSNQTDLQSALDGKQATGDYITALTGDVTATGPGSVAGTIANQAVTFAKFQNIAQDRLLGRISAGTGSVEELTAQNIRDLILGYYTIQDTGTSLTQRATLNFTGSGVTCSDDAGNVRTTCDIPGGSSTGYDTIEEDGVGLTQRTTVNFTGGGITCADNGVSSETDCDVPTNPQTLDDLETPTNDTVLVGSGTTWENKTVPDCTDSTGNHLNYTQSTNTISCGTSSSVTDTNASTICTGTQTYLDGEGGCDTLDGLEDFETATDDGLVVGNGTGFDTKVVGDCTDSAGNHLNYTAATNTFSCGTSSSVTDTNAQTICTGTDNYLDGEGNCDVLVTESTAAGRSVTLTGSTIDADAELFTIAKSIVITSPSTSNTNQAQLYFGSSVTLTRVVCSTDTGTVTIQFDERAEATPNTAGTNVLTAALVCDTTSEVTTSFSNAGIAVDVPLNLQITADTGTPGVVRIHLKGTKDD